MKSFFLVLLVASVATVTRAQDMGSIGTDFVIDNILKPMLSGIYDNTIGFLINQMFGLLGKRDLSSTVNEVVAQVASLFESLKDKLSAIVHQFGSQLQEAIGNIFKPGQSYAQILATVKALLKQAVAQFMSKFSQLLQQFFGQNNTMARGIFQNLTQIMGELVNTIHQSLSVYAEDLSQAVQAASLSLKPMLGNLSQHVINAVQQAIQHLNQIIAQISGN